MFRNLAWAAHFRMMRSYFGISAVLFLAGIVTGITATGFSDFLDQQLKGIKDLSDIINQSSNPTLMGIVVIFFNNAIKAGMIVYLGFLFGIYPVIFIVLNGMVIGYLMHKYYVAEGAATMFEVLVKGILPHGIIEIPLIIIASAYGLRSGNIAIRWIGALFNGTKAKAMAQETERYVITTLPVVLGIVLLLLVASLIESTITPLLLQK
ncbi:stage II sporulation protein M [Paenibacillus cellulosilyticus]|uniref:Stage II sporulation protein M n=1 Tax=Paenibacillus cellulosilyticus TaxID=375489 RepID=A0A2V2YNU5_9BACL|nr:stage II sporulation protein M [Paenibacillus cellulosilyticus]PWV94370.1 stage II sporulation protein M [Paenibacillus cellulosilyticus]QKS47803.1 stage II sporulation protein M [Paenibacillus cellulosilyticus]